MKFFSPKLPLFVALVKARVPVDFRFFSIMKNMDEFISQWCFTTDICSVTERELSLYLPFSYSLSVCTGWLLRVQWGFSKQVKCHGRQNNVYAVGKGCEQGKTKWSGWHSLEGFNNEVKPMWRALYKPPLTKRVGGLQWRNVISSPLCCFGRSPRHHYNDPWPFA